MPKFILHRIRRMTQNPALENITPGLEAAAYLHWITCYERDPRKFTCVEPQLPELRRHVADYFAITEREINAHLELMASPEPDGPAGHGAKGVQPAPRQPLPGDVTIRGAQNGWNWILLYWEPAACGGKPWGYRVYRRANNTAPELVATVVQTEALLPDQPERVKFYYEVRAFNAAGEGPAQGCLGILFNGPENDDDAPMPPLSAATGASAAPPPAFSEPELSVRRDLGEALMNFVQKLGATRLGQDDEDSVMRQVATEEFRQAVEKAARQNIEVSLVWHTLGIWTEEGKERIGCFARALQCRRAETAATPPHTPAEHWAAVHMEADCLFEIGRVHFHEGAPEVARAFLTEALPLARQADSLRIPAGVEGDNLEGRVAELLLRLPGDEV